MMMDRQSTQVAPVESNGSQAAVAASDASSMQPAGQSSSSQMTPQPDVTSPAVAGPAAAKSRVFKMSDEFLMFKFKVRQVGTAVNMSCCACAVQQLVWQYVI